MFFKFSLIVRPYKASEFHAPNLYDHPTPVEQFSYTFA